MPVYPTKSNKKNARNRRFKCGVILTTLFSILLVFLLFNFFEILSITLLGTFGLILYPISVFFIVIGIMLMLNKHIKTTKSILILSIVWLCVFTLILQMATSQNIDGTFTEYLKSTFKENLTAGGVLFGSILYPLYALTYDVAVYIILAIVLVILTAFLIDKIYIGIKNAPKKAATKAPEIPENEISDKDDDEDFENEVYLKNTNASKEDDDEDIIIPDENEEDVQKAKRKLGLFTNEIEEEQEENIDYKNKLEQTFTVHTSNTLNQSNSKKPNIYVHDEDTLETPSLTMSREQKEKDEKKRKEDERRQAALDYLKISSGKFESKTKEVGIDNVSTKKESKELSKQTDNNLNRLSSLSDRFNNLNNNQKEIKSGYNPFKQREEKVEQVDIYDETFTKKQFQSEFENRNKIPENASKVYSGETNENIVEAKGFSPVQITINDPVKKPKGPKIYKKPPKYIKPPIDLLKSYSTEIDIDDHYMEEKGNLIVETLKAFKIETKIINAVKGPTFTRFELQMAPGISVNAVNNKVNDLSMALESTCRVQVPIPGKNAFGIEVPNKKRVIVGIREMLESQNFQNSKSELTFALGKDIAGDCKVACIDKLVHTLVAGSTGSGKSVCLNTMLISLLYKASPEDLRLILVDPKTVEFSMFNNLPHMLIPNTITECEKAVSALGWLVEEMDRRYKQLSNLGVKKISEYNETPEVLSGAVPKMFYIVLVFDEVGDFMTRARKEIEEKIMLLAAKSRACGIHIVLATQRPTVDVITGTIKANLPSRIAFAVNSYNDSKTILENSGAEYLLGLGDMLFLPQGSNDMARIQGCLINNNEVKAVINFIKENNEAIFDEEIEDQMFNKKEGFDPSNGVDDAFDPMLKDCLRYFIKAKKASASSLQGYFGIGYPKANKIVLQMEKAGFVSAGDSNGRRTLFITQQEFEERFGEDLDE